METQQITISQAAYKVIKSILKQGADRESLRGVFIDQENICCTNGRALLAIKHDQKYIPGNWNIIGAEKSASARGMMRLTLSKLDAEFPDYKNIMPAQTKETIQITLADSYSVSRAMFDLFKFTGSAFCYDILNILSPLGLTWTADKADRDKAVLLNVASMRAVIMPFKI